MRFRRQAFAEKEIAALRREKLPLYTGTVCQFMIEVTARVKTAVPQRAARRRAEMTIHQKRFELRPGKPSLSTSWSSYAATRLIFAAAENF